MKRLFNKDPVWFAVVWILIYVIGFANADSLSETLGMPKVLTVLAGLAMTVILLCFARRNQLFGYLGLCRVSGSGRKFLYFLPLILISSINLWNGVTLNRPVPETLAYVLSMCFVGLLEEVIFRGLLFQGMRQNNVTTAIVISSLTFGVGHIVNLLLGEPLMDTLLQLVYASAIGFCYTVIFHVGGSIVPCIVSHGFVNCTSIFAVQPSARMQIILALVQTLLSTGYGLWLLADRKNNIGGTVHAGNH